MLTPSDVLRTQLIALCALIQAQFEAKTAYVDLGADGSLPRTMQRPLSALMR
ncbi:hypothetical protein HC761_01365 [bacterium]|nr:hypothetical protein [bacterium]